MSDGSEYLTFLEPRFHEGRLAPTFVMRIITDVGEPLSYINELEYVSKNELLANLLFRDYPYVARIDLDVGILVGLYNFSSIAPLNPPGVFNGIALDKETNRLFVTGKFWEILAIAEI
eukprot:UC4_evm2s932